MFSACSVHTKDASETASAGHSLALSVYDTSVTILLTGELGAGKTTFTQGFASGLGIAERVASPTYALEQRYEGFTHLDLYRLNSQQAEHFLSHSEDVKGIRLIEWAERIDPTLVGPHVHVHIIDRTGTREIQCHFLDHAVPTDAAIDAWMDEVRLPAHIRAHCETVTRVADTLAKSLVDAQQRLVRLEAVHAAARTHDLLRFVDFKTWQGDELYSPTEDDRHAWERLKETYGTPHEEAAARFLTERGFASVGEIIRAHRGADKQGNVVAKTTEQLILAYADKRVAFDRVVSIDERFDDFIKRYGNVKESTEASQWRNAMKHIEKNLFPHGVPSL